MSGSIRTRQAVQSARLDTEIFGDIIRPCQLTVRPDDRSENHGRRAFVSLKRTWNLNLTDRGETQDGKSKVS